MCVVGHRRYSYRRAVLWRGMRGVCELRVVRGVPDGGQAVAGGRERGPLGGVRVPRRAHDLVGPARAALRGLHAVPALHVADHLR